MDQSILPLNFYCRNARLCLKKAAFSKKSQLFADELLHLKKFDVLVSSTIPSHPLFEDKKAEKQILELQVYLVETRKRIQQLETDSAPSKPISTAKEASGAAKAEKTYPKSKTSLRSPRFSSELLASMQKSQKKARTMPKRHESPRRQQSWESWPSNNYEVQASLSASSSSPPSKKQVLRTPKGKRLAGAGGMKFNSPRTKEFITTSPGESPSFRLKVKRSMPNFTSVDVVTSQNMGNVLETAATSSGLENTDTNRSLKYDSRTYHAESGCPGEQFPVSVGKKSTDSKSLDLIFVKKRDDMLKRKGPKAHSFDSENKMLTSLQTDSKLQSSPNLEREKRTIKNDNENSLHLESESDMGSRTLTALSWIVDELKVEKVSKNEDSIQGLDQEGPTQAKQFPGSRRELEGRAAGELGVSNDGLMNLAKTFWEGNETGNILNSNQDLGKAESMHKEWTCSKKIGAEMTWYLNDAIKERPQGCDHTIHKGEDSNRQYRSEEKRDLLGPSRIILETKACSSLDQDNLDSKTMLSLGKEDRDEPRGGRYADIRHVTSNQRASDCPEDKIFLRDVEGKAGLAIGIRMKLEEEYERLREQMKTMKSKGEGTVRKAAGAKRQQDLILAKQRIEAEIHAAGQNNETESGQLHTVWDKPSKEREENTQDHVQNNTVQIEKQGSERQRTRYFAEAECQMDTPLKFHSGHMVEKINGGKETTEIDNIKNTEEQWIQADADIAMSTSTSNLKEGHGKAALQSCNSNPAASSSPASPFLYHPALPFSHYISKLKQLVPAETSSLPFDWPLHPPSNCEPHMARSDNPSSPPFSGPFSCPCDQVENTYAHSLSSSDTFAESLTYSNPVFDFELEPGTPECNSRLFPMGRDKPGERVAPEDERLGAILGGCSHLAGQLQSFEGIKDERSNSGLKVDEKGEFDSPTRKQYSLPKMEDTKDVNLSSFDWHENQERPDDYEDERKVPTMDDDLKSPEEFTIVGQKFRFAKDFFRKRLQEKMNCIEQRKNPNVGEQSSETPPECSRGALEEKLEESSEGSLHDDWRSLGRYDDLNQRESLEKMLCTSLEERKCLQRTRPASKEETLVGNCVPSMEANSTLPFVRSNQKASCGISGNAGGKAVITGGMDGAIRHSLDSDSGVSNISSSRQAEHFQECSIKIARSDVCGLQTEIGQSKWIGECIDHGSGCQHQFQGVQVESIEERIRNLQHLVGEMKCSVEGITIRVEEDKNWQWKIQELERDLQILRDHSEGELQGIKGYINEEVNIKLNELLRGLGKAEKMLTETGSQKESFEQKMELRLEDCSTKMESIKKQTESLVGELKTSIIKEMKENTAVDFRNFSGGIKSHMEVLELGIAKDINSLRQELNFTIDPQDEERRKIDIETLVEEKVEKWLAQHMGIVSGGKEDISEMKSELRLLWEEVDLLFKGREEIKDQVEKLTQVAEKAKDSFSKEQGLLRSENGMLRKQLQYFKKESMKTRIDVEDFKKETELEMENVKRAIGNMKEDGEYTRRCTETLKKLEDGLRAEKINLRKLIEKTKEEEAARKVEFEAFKKSKEEFERERGDREKTLIMERVENLSQLYLGGLKEVRGDLLNMKLTCQDRLEELECQWEDLVRRQNENILVSGNSLGELVLDGLETRVSHLEHKMEQNQDLDRDQFRVESMLAIIDKDRELAATAAVKAVASAHKADELLAEMLGSFTSEIASARKKSMKLQESLALERDAVAAAASEVKRMNADLGREREMVVAALSEARRKSFEIQEGLERERSHLRSSVVSVEKEKEAATAAALEAAAAAAKVEEMLAVLSRAQRDSLSIHYDIKTESLGQAPYKFGKDLEREIEGWKNSMLTEFAKAKSVTEGFDEEKRKASICLLSEASVCTGHFEERNISQEELDHRIKRTEDIIAHLARTVKEMSDSLDSQLSSRVSRKPNKMEEKEEAKSNEIHDLRERMEQVVAVLDKISTNSSQLEEEQKKQEAFWHDLSKQMIGNTTEQTSIVEKVAEVSQKIQKLEGILMKLTCSVEEVQTSTADLEKSSAVWMPKYEAAARVLTEFETRICLLENSFQRDECAEIIEPIEKMQSESVEKQQLLSLYKEMSGFVERMQKIEGEEGSRNILEQSDLIETSLATPLNTRLAELENRINHVESATLNNLRMLDAKMEQFSAGVQTALEGATMAESKCSALGAELVKVFRMLVSSKKEIPSKVVESDESSEQCRQSHKVEIPSGVKSKTPTSHAACAFCKRAALKGSCGATDGARDPSSLELRQRDTGAHLRIHEGFLSSEGHKVNHGESKDPDNRSPMMERGVKECAVHGKLAAEPHTGSTYPHSTHIPENDAPFTKLSRKYSLPAGQSGEKQREREGLSKVEEQGVFDAVKRNDSKMKIFEGRLPITQEKLNNKRIECGKKESMHSSSARDYQMTNIRLDTGQIHVNVSHRSAFITGTRLVKRGDTFTIKPER